MPSLSASGNRRTRPERRAGCRRSRSRLRGMSAHPHSHVTRSVQMPHSSSSTQSSTSSQMPSASASAAQSPPQTPRASSWLPSSIAFRDVRASAIVDGVGAVADAALVEFANAVVAVVTDAVSIGVCRAVATTDAKRVKLVAVQSQSPSGCPHIHIRKRHQDRCRCRTRRRLRHSRRRRHRCHRHRHLPRSHRHTRCVELPSCRVFRDVRTSARVDLTWPVAAHSSSSPTHGSTSSRCHRHLHPHAITATDAESVESRNRLLRECRCLTHSIHIARTVTLSLCNALASAHAASSKSRHEPFSSVEIARRFVGAARDFIHIAHAVSIEVKQHHSTAQTTILIGIAKVCCQCL